MIINNQFDNIHLKSSSLLECFDNVEWEKKISLSMWVNKYASIVHSSKVDYEIETNQENWDSDFFFLCPVNEYFYGRMSPMIICLIIRRIYSSISKS